ncbi:MAG: tetratricopeptide repeat protein [Limisphaerales bacterium]
MQPLEPPDTHYLSAALGWLGLGNQTEAKAELASISPSRQHHPDVLEARWAVYSDEKNWDAALEAARALIKEAPERPAGWVLQAYALRRVHNGGLQQAWDALRPALDLFPLQPVIPFNLACYSCQMRRLEEARSWLARAAQAGEKNDIKQMALGEEDLEPLWEEIRRWH